jgi:DNA repair protein RadC
MHARWPGLPAAQSDAALVRAPSRTGARREDADADALETRELVALVLGGSAPRALAAASKLLECIELAELSRASVGHVRRASGLSTRSAARLVAAFALGRRVRAAYRAPRPDLRSPASVHELLADDLRGLSRETFHALLLDSKHRLRRRHRISEGTLTSALVHPREVFGPALREGACALIVAHNHPSGDPEPSSEDLAVTRRLLDAGRLLGVPLLDHVVICDERFVSIRERISFDPA